jgi:hypothetical protein
VFRLVIYRRQRVAIAYRHVSHLLYLPLVSISHSSTLRTRLMYWRARRACMRRLRTTVTSLVTHAVHYSYARRLCRHATVTNGCNGTHVEVRRALLQKTSYHARLLPSRNTRPPRAALNQQMASIFSRNVDSLRSLVQSVTTRVTKPASEVPQPIVWDKRHEDELKRLLPLSILEMNDGTFVTTAKNRPQ